MNGRTSFRSWIYFLVACAPILPVPVALAEDCVDYTIGPPSEITSFTIPSRGRPTPREAAGSEMYGDYLVLATTSSGYGYYGTLEIMSVSNLGSPFPIGFTHMDSDEGTYDLAVRDDLAYVATSDGIQIVDLSAFWEPQVVGGVSQDLTTLVEVEGDRLYAAQSVLGSGQEVQVFDLANPLSPALLGTWTTFSGYLADIDVQGNYLYGVTNLTANTFYVVDASNPASLSVVGSAQAPSRARSVEAKGSLVYAAGWTSISCYNVANPAVPVSVGGAPVPGYTFDLAAVGGVLYAAGDASGPRAFDISSPNPSILGAATAVTRHHTIEIGDDVLFITANNTVRAFPLHCDPATSAPPTSVGAGLELAVTPNPMSSESSVRFSLPTSGVTTLEVYDAAGRLVRRLAGRDFVAGVHELLWDGRDDRGREVGAGVYFAQVRQGEFQQSRKITRLPR